jgi:hypothetical protein
MLTRFYQSPLLDVQNITQGLETEHTANGFHVQILGDADQMIVQLKKESVIRFLLGFNKAIGVTMERIADGFLVKIGAQDWIDKAVVAINPRTAPAALLGAIDQNKIVHHVMDALDRLAHEQQPGVQWSDAPRGV